MKKTKLLLALVLSVIMSLVPTYALTLDTAEQADANALQNQAVLAADPGIETTHELYGTLLFYEDFEDQSVESWYFDGATGAKYDDAVQSLIVANPNGDGYVADLAYYNPFYLTVKEATVYDELTFVVDVYGKPDTTLGSIGYYCGTWYDLKSAVKTAETWTTLDYPLSSVTLSGTNTLSLNNTANYYVDNVRVYGKTVETEGVYASKPADSVPTYGNLVYFDNFSGDTGFTNKADLSIVGLTDTAVIKNGSNAVLAAATCEGLPGNVRGITVASGENGWTYTDGTPMQGTLAIYGEQYVLKNDGTKTYSVINAEAQNTLTYPWAWSSTMSVGAGSNMTVAPENYKWTSGFSHTQPITDTLTRFGYAATKTDTLYAFRSVAVYFMPETKVTIVNGDSTEYVDLYGFTEYTLPEINGEGAYYTVWVDEDGTKYAPGTTLNASDIKDKTFTALVTTAPLLDEEKGALVLFHGFEGNEYSQIEYFDDEHFKTVEWSSGDGLGFNTFVHAADSEDASNKVLEMTIKDGAAYQISGFQYTLDGKAFVPKEGTYSQLIDIYNRNEGSTLSRDSIYSTDIETSFGAWGRSKDITFTPFTWVKDVAFETLTVTKNTDPETSETAEYVIAWGADDYQKSDSNVLKHIQHRFVDAGKTSVTVDNYRLYFYPANAFMVKNDGVLVMETGAADGTYTFKAPSEIFGGEYAANVCYTDGESSYCAGQTVDVAKIAGKTLTLTEAVAENSGKAEIRVSNVAKDNGVRFMASITQSLKAQAKEYGFIVARDDVLVELGASLTFDLGGEGTVYAKGAAYKLDENGEVVTDKVYSDNDDGSMNFTGVCVGLDLTNKLQVTTNIVARPYVVLEDADGNEFVAYGKTHIDSLAGVAQDLKNAADSGDEAAITAYEGASYDGGNYIDDILATANN